MSRAGFAPNASARIAPPPGRDGSSASDVVKIMRDRHIGCMRIAHNAATPLMKPSTTATALVDDIAMYAPTMAAISSPPTHRRAVRALI